MLAIDHKFSAAITLCKAMGISALFIAWQMYPPSSAKSVPTKENVMEVEGELRKVSGHNKGVYALEMQTSKFDGKVESRSFKWVTAVDETLIGQFRPGRHLHVLIPRERPVLAVGKPHSWGFRLDGVVLMSVSEGVKRRQAEIRELERRALVVLTFGVALLACTFAATYRFGRAITLRETAGAGQSSQSRGP